MENIPCKNGAPAHARGRRNLWSIYPLHTPHKGPGSRLSAGQRLFRPLMPLRPPLSLQRAPVPQTLRPFPQARHVLLHMRRQQTCPGPEPALSPTGRHLTEPAAHGPSCHKKRPPSHGRRSFYPNGLFLPRQEQSTCACDRCPAPAGSGTEAVYFFRASESTMAWAWASSTFPASRTSTCRSAPRASTPRMGMFPAWPCIS